MNYTNKLREYRLGKRKKIISSVVDTNFDKQVRRQDTNEKKAWKKVQSKKKKIYGY